MLNLLIGPISQLAGTWLEGKVETKKAETARQQGMRQALPDPKYGRYKSWWDKRHEKPKKVEIDMSLFED